MRRRSLLQLAAGGLMIPAAFSAEAQISLATAINRAARFRALSQRCAKAYAQLHLDVMPDGARDVLAAAQRLIQLGFEDLARGSFGPAVTQPIAAIRKESDELMRLLTASPTKASVLAVSGQADRMLLVANKATEALEAQTKVTSAKLVDTAGRQRMLSQRLAKNFFLSATGVDTRPLREQMMSDSVEFIDALGALGRKPDANSMRTVATTSERLLEVMNNLTTLYEDALKELLGQA